MSLENTFVNMLIAMGITAFLCIAIGVFPAQLYSLLPNPVDYKPYTSGHVITQLQLLLFSILAFALLIRYKIYPPELKSTNLDFDWFYRKPLKLMFIGTGKLIDMIYSRSLGIARFAIDKFLTLIAYTHADGKLMSRTTTSGSAVAVIVALFGLALLMIYK